jgi:hypothetical protein
MMLLVLNVPVFAVLICSRQRFGHNKYPNFFFLPFVQACSICEDESHGHDHSHSHGHHGDHSSSPKQPGIEMFHTIPGGHHLIDKAYSLHHQIIYPCD